MKYFRIIDSFESHDRWYLESPKTFNGTEIDPRLFTAGYIYKDKNLLQIPIKRGLKPLDFTLASFDMPIVRKEIAKRIQSAAVVEIQRIPVNIIGEPADYEIVNVLTVLNAINEKFSEISWWTKADGIPNKIGTYFGIAKLVLNEKEIRGFHIFRLKNWELPIIISETIKNNLEQVTGVAFEELQLA